MYERSVIPSNRRGWEDWRRRPVASSPFRTDVNPIARIIFTNECIKRLELTPTKPRKTRHIVSNWSTEQEHGAVCSFTLNILIYLRKSLLLHPTDKQRTFCHREHLHRGPRDEPPPLGTDVKSVASPSVAPVGTVDVGVAARRGGSPLGRRDGRVVDTEANPPRARGWCQRRRAMVRILPASTTYCRVQRSFQSILVILAVGLIFLDGNVSSSSTSLITPL